MILFSSIPPIKSGSIRRRTVEVLRDAIFNGSFRPGQRMVELTLGRELGVSQATVREALYELEHLGLVERTANVGTNVVQITPQMVFERTKLRALLEGYAVAEAMDRITNEDIRLLKEKAELIEFQSTQNDIILSAVADLEFHSYLWGLSENRTMIETLERITCPLFAFLSINHPRGPMQQHRSGHGEIIAALQSRSRAEARRAMYRHAEATFNLFPDEVNDLRSAYWSSLEQ